MPKICYVQKKFSREHLAIIRAANGFLERYAAGGYQVTLRSLYYAFVKSNLLKNEINSYKRLGKIVGDARLAGLIDWNHLEDRTRNLERLTHFDGPQDALNKLKAWYHVDMWAKQKYRPEVWIEKDALSGIIRGVCEENDIPFFCCRGYTSISEMWQASVRLRYYSEKLGQTPYIIHFGDHDPSGIDMSRDITYRLGTTFLSEIEFERVALNMSQIEEFELPPNPAKQTDSRFKEYEQNYGDESWELDALEPDTFRSIIESHVKKIQEPKQWKADLAEKQKVKATLTDIAQDWEQLPSLREEVVKLGNELTKAKAELAKKNRRK